MCIIKRISNIGSDKRKMPIKIISEDNLEKDSQLSKSFWAIHTETHKTKKTENIKISESKP